jgi:hypothetical protein
MPPANTRPGRVCRQDDSRLGLLTGRRRRLTARGVQPLGVIQPTLDWFDVYGAVAPAPGERCFLELPSLPADMCQLFVDAFAQALPDRLTIPANVRLVFLPPCCPELNPIERVWRDLKDAIAWQPFSYVDTQ